jgi:hypothetical protein
MQSGAGCARHLASLEVRSAQLLCQSAPERHPSWRNIGHVPVSHPADTLIICSKRTSDQPTIPGGADYIIVLSQCFPCLQGKMRIGLAEQTVISALGQAVVLSEEPPVPPKELPARLDEVSGRMPSSLAF